MDGGAVDNRLNSRDRRLTEFNGRALVGAPDPALRS